MKTKIKYQIDRKKTMKKNTDKLLQKQTDRYIHFKELLRNYVDLENRLKALEESFSTNVSKKQCLSYRWL